MNRYLAHAGFVLETFYEAAGLGWSPETAAYVEQNELDLEMINAHAGVLAIVGCRFLGNGRFELDADGEPAAIIEAFGNDAATTIDLCAWPINAPEAFATAIGAAAGLGIANVINPASWFGRRAMPVHRTPLGWLKSGCDGCVVLDHRLVSHWLRKALGPIGFEDNQHCREIEALLNPRPFPRNRIVRRRAA
jgi:hypothetical protein